MNAQDPATRDEALSAWLDGEGTPEQRAEVEAWLHEHPEDAARVRAWEADRQALREHFAAALHEPVPAALQRQLLVSGGGVAANEPSWPRWGLAAAACGLLLAGGVIGAWLGPQLSAGQQAAGTPAPWVQRAAAAHAVYVPEVRHPVEVNVAEGDAAQNQAQEEHLARWLTKRLAAPVKTFNLQAQGFQLVGGRLLPDGTAPGAQLMYQNSAGQRVTVYLRKPEAGTLAAFRFERVGELSLFYWVDGATGYALVGPLPREQLLALAEAIYQQGAKARP